MFPLILWIACIAHYNLGNYFGRLDRFLLNLQSVLTLAFYSFFSKTFGCTMSRDQLKGIPMSDAWLEKSSDDSDSADRSLEFVKRPKAKHDWPVSRSRHGSDYPFDVHDDSDIGDSDELDNDDADDEDWTAYDHDKKVSAGLVLVNKIFGILFTIVVG